MKRSDKRFYTVMLAWCFILQLFMHKPLDPWWLILLMTLLVWITTFCVMGLLKLIINLIYAADK